MLLVARRPRPPSLNAPSARELDDLLLAARALQRGAAASPAAWPLRGRHLGLLRERQADAEEARLFHAAASALGARVAEVHARLDEASTPQQVRRTARVLGRLYDAIECQGLPECLVRQVAAEAGVPVYDGLASARHPTARLADRLDPGRTRSDRRQLVLQAVLQTLR